MSESKGSYWPYIVIALLCFGIGTLLSIEKEIKAQRTPEQVAAIGAQARQEKEAGAYLDAQREKDIERLRESVWSELNTEEYLEKFLAENYHLFLFGLIIIASGPMLMRKVRPY